MGQDFAAVRSLTREIESKKGTLGNSAGDLLNVLRLSDELGKKIGLYVYARMRRDGNNAKPNYQALFDRAQTVSIEAGSATAFIVPEILQIQRVTCRNFSRPVLTWPYTGILLTKSCAKRNIFSPERKDYWLCPPTSPWLPTTFSPC